MKAWCKIDVYKDANIIPSIIRVKKPKNKKPPAESVPLVVFFFLIIIRNA